MFCFLFNDQFYGRLLSRSYVSSRQRNRKIDVHPAFKRHDPRWDVVTNSAINTNKTKIQYKTGEKRKKQVNRPHKHEQLGP